MQHERHPQRAELGRMTLLLTNCNYLGREEGKWGYRSGDRFHGCSTKPKNGSDCKGGALQMQEQFFRLSQGIRNVPPFFRITSYLPISNSAAVRVATSLRHLRRHLAGDAFAHGGVH